MTGVIQQLVRGESILSNRCKLGRSYVLVRLLEKVLS
jgi:hypothetical protein